MALTTGEVTSLDAEYSWSAVVVGLTRPRPPSLQGRASKALRSSFGAGLPVKAGMNFVLMMSSRG